MAYKPNPTAYMGLGNQQQETLPTDVQVKTGTEYVEDPDSPTGWYAIEYMIAYTVDQYGAIKIIKQKDEDGNDVDKIYLGYKPTNPPYTVPKEVTPETKPLGILQADWDATEKDPDLRNRLRTWSENQLTDPSKKPIMPITSGYDWKWNPNNERWTLTEVKAAQAEDKIGSEEIEDAAGNVWRYKTVNGEIDMSQAPVQVKGAKPSKKATRTRDWQVADGTIWEMDEEQDASGKWVAVGVPRVSQPSTKKQPKSRAAGQLDTIVKGGYTFKYNPETGDYDIPVGKAPKEPLSAAEIQAETDAKVNAARVADAWAQNPRNLTAALAYLRDNPLPIGRELPDNGANYPVQGGYTPAGKPPQQTLQALIQAMGVGITSQPTLDIKMGQNRSPVRLVGDTSQMRQAVAAGAKPTLGPTLDDFLRKLPFSQQQWDAQNPEQIAAMEALGSSQGLGWQTVNPTTGALESTHEYEKFVKGTNIPFWRQASSEQETDRISRDPAAMKAIYESDPGVLAARKVREQMGIQAQGNLSSQLRGTGKRRFWNG